MLTLQQVSIQRYYLIIAHIVPTLKMIPITHIFFNWKFVSLNLPPFTNLILRLLDPFPSGNHLFVCCIYVSVLLCVFSFLRFHMRVES